MQCWLASCERAARDVSTVISLSVPQRPEREIVPTGMVICR
jgi:hypothetical protein